MDTEGFKLPNSITVPVCKQVEPVFNSKNVLRSIKIMPNMLYSLIANKTFDNESMFLVEEITLVSKNKHRTVVKIQNDHEWRTTLHLDGSIEYFVKRDIIIKKGSIVVPRARMCQQRHNRVEQDSENQE